MDQQPTDAQTELAKAVAHFGNQSKLAKKIGVSDPTVSEWMSGVRPIPPLRAMQIEQIIPGNNIKASRLNPKVGAVLGASDSKRRKATERPVEQARERRTADRRAEFSDRRSTAIDVPEEKRKGVDRRVA